MSAQPGSVRRRAWAAAALVALVLGGLVAPGAQASPRTPTPPTAGELRRAHEAAAAAALMLTRAQAQSDAAQARLDAIDAQAEAVVESWNAARAEAAAAAAVLALARQDSERAASAADTAQVGVDRLAAASYQVGADLSGGLGEWASVVDSVFSDGGIQGLADRVAAVGQVAAGRRHDIESASALRLTALQAEQAAVRASEALTAREAVAAAAAVAVRASQQSQLAEVTRLMAQRSAAAGVLATARGRASSLDRARRQALVAAAAARAAAARAAAAAAAAGKARGHQGGHPPTDSGGSSRSWPVGHPTSSPAQRAGALAFAKLQLGKPYLAGAHGPDAYDCSGLTSAAYRSVGISMIQYSKAQFAAYPKVPVSQLQPGDLVFFAFDPSDWLTIHHVAIYSGGGQMVEAPHTGDVVKFQTIWQTELVPYGARP